MGEVTTAPSRHFQEEEREEKEEVEKNSTAFVHCHIQKNEVVFVPCHIQKNEVVFVPFCPWPEKLAEKGRPTTLVWKEMLDCWGSVRAVMRE
jgi:hypothetical protein